MPYTPSYYKYVPRERIENKSLNVISNTFNTLQQRHDATIEGASKLKEAIAKLPLNPAEEGYRQELFNQVENALANDKEQGFVGFGYNDIVKVSGDISSDENLIGKLRNQESYKKYMDTIDASDLPEQYKRYFKDKNQYYTYAPEDQYTEDENGNKIKVGGREWTPTKIMNKSIDYNDFFAKAIKYIHPKTGKSEVVEYLDATGNLTTNVKKAAIPVWHDIVTDTYKIIPEEDLRNALNAAIAGDPEAMNSLKQDLEIAKWAINNGEEPLYNIMSNKNGTMTLNQFKDSIFEPFIKSFSGIVDSTSSVRSNNNYAKLAETYLNNLPKTTESGASGMFDRDTRGNMSPDNTMEYNNTTSAQVLGKLSDINKDLNRQIKSILPDIRLTTNKDGKTVDYHPSIFKLDELKSKLAEAGVDKNSINNIITTYSNEYAEELRYYNKYFSDTENPEVAAALTKATILSNGEFKDRDEMSRAERRYYDAWTKMIDKYYGDGDTLLAGYGNNKVYNSLKKNIQDAINSGDIPEDAIVYQHIGSQNCIGIKKEYSGYLPVFNNLLRNAEQEETGLGRFNRAVVYGISDFVDRFNKNDIAWGNTIWQYNREDGNVRKLRRDFDNSANSIIGMLFGPISNIYAPISNLDNIKQVQQVNGYIPLNNKQLLSPISSYMDAMDRKESRSEMPTKSDITTFRINSANSEELLNNIMTTMQGTDYETYNKILTAMNKGNAFIQEQVKRAMPNSFMNSRVYINSQDGDSGKSVAASSEVKNIINKYIQQSDLKNSFVNLSYLPQEGILVPSIDITVTKELAKALGKGYEEGQNINLKMSGLNIPTINELNDNSFMPAFHELYVANANNKDLRIPSFNKVGNSNLFIVPTGENSFEVVADSVTSPGNDIKLFGFNFGSLENKISNNESEFYDLINLRYLQNEINKYKTGTVIPTKQKIAELFKLYNSLGNRFFNLSEEECAEYFNAELGMNALNID